MEVVGGLDLRDKTVLITGGTGGLGLETTRAFASAGATVVATARDMGRARMAIADIAKSVEVEELDLNSLASVHALASRWNNRKLDILINNAGIMRAPYALTKDGFQQQIGVNHLAHFLLATLLAPALERGSGSRLVVLTSAAHRRAAWNAEDPHFARRPYDTGDAYGESKTANALFALGYDQRFRDKGIRAFSVMPGVIETGLFRYMSDDEVAEIKNRVGSGAKSPEQGAATTVWAAIGHELNGHGGLYLENCAQAIPASNADFTQGVADYAQDPVAADRLWDWSLQQVGLVGRSSKQKVVVR